MRWLSGTVQNDSRFSHVSKSWSAQTYSHFVDAQTALYDLPTGIKSPLLLPRLPSSITDCLAQTKTQGDN
jgi:hypothetical protein